MRAVIARPLVRAVIAKLHPRGDLSGADDCDLDALLERFRRETTMGRLDALADS